MTIEHDLRAFLIDEVGYAGPPGVLTSDFLLIENEVVDSLAIFQIVALIEDRYGIELEDEELIPKNFGTLGAIARLITSKTT
ncbi:MAG: acyl carrier protein [Acidimicrobiales bacterium]